MTQRSALLAARIVFAIWALAVAWTSLLPQDDLPSTLLVSDKVIHLLAYAALGMLAILSGLTRIWAFAAVMGWGLALEVAQGLLGYRSFEWADLLADGLGASVAIVVTGRVVTELRARQQRSNQEAKRALRRKRRERRVTPERPMNPAKAAARRGPPTWQQVVQKQGAKCWLCTTRTYVDDHRRDASGRERLGRTYPEVDYVVPVERGGTFEDSNIRLAHRHCAAARRKNPALMTYGKPPRTFT